MMLVRESVLGAVRTVENGCDEGVVEKKQKDRLSENQVLLNDAKVDGDVLQLFGEDGQTDQGCEENEVFDQRDRLHEVWVSNFDTHRQSFKSPILKQSEVIGHLDIDGEIR